MKRNALASVLKRSGLDIAFEDGNAAALLIGDQHELARWVNGKIARAKPWEDVQPINEIAPVSAIA